MKDNSRSAGHIAAFVTILIWGTTFISTKHLLNSFAPLEILFLRFVMGFFALNVIYPRRMKKTAAKQELLFAAAGLCGVTLYFLLENIALTYTLASNVGVLVCVAPFFTALLSYFFLDGERPGVYFFAGFLLAMAGVFLVSMNGQITLDLNPKGDMLAILAAFFWSCYSVLTRKISAWGYHTVQTTRRIFGYGLIFMIPAVYFMQFRLVLARFTGAANLLNLLYLGFGASAACFVTWNFAIKILGAVKTSVYIYLVPVVTIATSMIVLDEPLTPIGAMGTGLILIGLFFSKKKERGGR